MNTYGMMISSGTDITLITGNEIVDKILHGRKKWLELLIKRKNKTLYRVSRGYIRQEDDILDNMQKTCLKAYVKLGQFRRKAGFST